MNKNADQEFYLWADGSAAWIISNGIAVWADKCQCLRTSHADSFNPRRERNLEQVARYRDYHSLFMHIARRRDLLFLEKFKTVFNHSQNTAKVISMNTAFNRVFIVFLFAVFQSCSSLPEPAPKKIELSFEGRAVEVWFWKPKTKPLATIIFSHGFASSPNEYDPLISAWLAEGYQVYAALHVDSNIHPETSKYEGMETWFKRLEDAKLLADTFTDGDYIAAGHSYGALLSLVKGGVNATQPENATESARDENVKLVLAFSPPGAIPGFIEHSGFSGLQTPALIQTGTKDAHLGAEWESHLDAFHGALPNGERYALVLDGVDHYFGGAICRSDVPGPIQIEEIGKASELSNQMISAFFFGNEEAKASFENNLSSSEGFTLTKR